ncbi:uncharacterized protein A1O9_00954 [Exophiala aquamarina CBS 119918]|uniref:Mtf2-like C-terminal domain-containing protein n=1 Tax=Exophiala aquamarina CBS 119918 TaxID=1182545 RepID=A0A072PS99_9EURO|nr:uncharacterized protein A1O9_00954 [Exophiala aquamarina CBS 119918]KEF62979.1 hypothetical protein A1O9_00954 [Exophiala aquamarina CBS 119918]
MAAKVELPFLYQTRTLFCRPRPSLHLHILQRCFGHEPQSHQNQAEIKTTRRPRKGWVRTKRPKVYYGLSQPLAAPTTGSNINLRSTITTTERKAFEAILLASEWSGGSKTPSPLVDAIDLDVDNILQLFRTSIETRNNVSQPIASPAGPDPNRIGQLSSTSKSWRPEENESVIGGIVRQRIHEIVNALQAAATSTQQPGDIALWHACEVQIFPLGQKLHGKPVYQAPEFLGPEKFIFTPEHSDVPSEILEEEKKRHRAEFEAKESDPPTTTQPAANSKLERTQKHILDSREARAVLHHVYPAALLYALRLFARDFPSSHFAFNLLPRIRELGHTSYVLGASTQFYNSLISLKWHRNSSLREVCQLLSEMKQNGVEFDEATCHIVHHIADEREATMMSEIRESANIHENGRTAAWWGRHGQAIWFPKLAEWLDTMTEQLSQYDLPTIPPESASQPQPALEKQ